MLLTAPLAALGLALLQWGLGRLVLRIGLREDSWLDRHLLQAAAGFLITYLLLFALAATGLYRPGVLVPLFWGLLIGVIALEGRGLATWIAGAFLSPSDERWTPLERAALPILVLFFGLCAFYALAPSTTWDPLDYHYELPRRWLLYGHFFQQSGIVYSEFPSATELHFGWLMALHSDLAANQYTLLTIATFLLAAIALGVRYCSRQAAVVGVLAVAGLPLVFTEQAQGGVVDCMLGTVTLLALGRALRWLETRERIDFWLMAMCAGLAVSIKHSGWMLGFFLFAMLLVDTLVRKQSLEKGIERIVGLGAAMFLLAAPWYLKSWNEMGNPVWPFADSLFNGSPKGYADILYWSNPNFSRSLTNLITWWWDVTTRVDLTQYRFRLITPVYLGLLPSLFGLFLKPSKALLLLAFCLFQIGILLFQAPGEPRYMLPAWALLGILIVHGAECADWLRLRWGPLAMGAMLLLPMAMSLALLQIESRDRLPYVLGQESREASYARRIETYPAIHYIEAHLQAGERAMHGDPRIYPFKDTSQIDVIYPFDHPGAPSFAREPRRVLKMWHERRVRFVTLSAGAHYMGLTRATLLNAQIKASPGPNGVLGIRSMMDGTLSTMLRQSGDAWIDSGPLPESPLGPLTARTLEIGSFTTREVTQLSNPRTTEPAAETPNYTVAVRPLQDRWKAIDVRIVLCFNQLIEDGALVKVLDNAACPVWEVHYPESWGPPGTDLKERPIP